MDITVKPRLLFLRWSDPTRPSYIQLHLQEQLKCLSTFFNVTVVNEGTCDYAELCETYEPDLALFESGVYVGTRKIINTGAHAHVPKIGFCNADAYCETREVFLSDMANWGIHTFFSISVSMPDYTPDMASSLFIWPNSVDTDLYKDYGESKRIPVLLSGSRDAHYPWRRAVSDRVSRYYPSLTCPHFGWSGGQHAGRMIFGEQYARTLNASWIVPTCGTIAHDLVRKHFEIPACKACLVTEDTAAVRAAGFADFINCVFAEESNIVDKLDYLFGHPEELERIICAGYDLVRRRHTQRHRDQLFQWFMLKKQLSPGFKIVQTHIFEPLTIVEDVGAAGNHCVLSNGLDRLLLTEGDAKLNSGKYEEAQACYIKCLNYQPAIPEAKLRLALCNLYEGRAPIALFWLLQPITRMLNKYGASDPDPVEWAYLIVCLLCQGRLKEAVERVSQFDGLRHIELERVRYVLSLLCSGRMCPIAPDAAAEQLSRFSVHRLESISLDEWLRNICRMLKAHNQSRYVDLIHRRKSVVESSEGMRPKQHYINHSLARSQTGQAPSRAPRSPSLARIMPAHVKIRQGLVSIAKRILHALHNWERRFGFCLPYRLSAIRTDELVNFVRQLARTKDMRAVLLLGAVARHSCVEALISGLSERTLDVPIVCVQTPAHQLRRLEHRYLGQQFVTTSAGRLADIKQEYGISSFDLVFLNGSRPNQPLDDGIYDSICGTRCVIIEEPNEPAAHRLYYKLAVSGEYLLLDHNFRNVRPYAILEHSICSEPASCASSNVNEKSQSATSVATLAT